jgi:hypothetical protein
MLGLPGIVGQRGLQEHPKACHWYLETGLEHWVEGAVLDVVYLMEKVTMVRGGEEEVGLEKGGMALEEGHSLEDIAEN